MAVVWLGGWEFYSPWCQSSKTLKHLLNFWHLNNPVGFTETNSINVCLDWVLGSVVSTRAIYGTSNFGAWYCKLPLPFLGPDPVMSQVPSAFIDLSGS